MNKGGEKQINKGSFQQTKRVQFDGNKEESLIRKRKFGKENFIDR